MALNVSQAETMLRSKFGEPAKPPTDYVVGFKTPEGKVLAIHREAAETRIWFQPPVPPTLDGVRLLDSASNGNSNINGPLLPLRAPTTLRVEIDSPGALNRFLDWYSRSGSAPRTVTAAAIDPLEAEGAISDPANRSSGGRMVGGWERSIIEMRMSILNTVRNSNGQIVERVVKDKQLLMDASELDELIRSRLELQHGKCNLTGLKMHAHGSDADPNLLPSADRIDSNRHYELDNIQVVCRFINFWKGASDNAEFQRLLMMVRGVDQ